MRKTCILTDSAALVDMEWARAHGVTVLRHQVRRAGQVAIEGEQPYPGLAREHDDGVVEPPPQAEVDACIARLARDADTLVAILSSARVTGIVSRVRTACGPWLGSRAVTLIDTQHIGLGVEFLVRAAAELAEQGADGRAIADRLRGLRHRVYASFASDDHSALTRAGVLRPAQGVLARKLGVVPIITLEDGRLAATEKVRSMDRAMERLRDFGAEFEAFEEAVVVHAAGVPDARARSLVRLLQAAVPFGADARLRPAGYHLSEALGPAGVGLMIYSSRTVSPS